MAYSVLVLHGPNLLLLAAKEIDPRLQARASELGVDLLTAQANGEEGLLDALHAQAERIDAILVNPGPLAPAAHALAEGLQLIGLPTVEVLLKALAPERGPSLLTGVVRHQIHGLGVEGYLRGLEILVPEERASRRAAELHGGKEEYDDESDGQQEESPAARAPRGKSIGRTPVKSSAAPQVPPGKSIGRKSPLKQGEQERNAVGAKADASATEMVTRAQVQERIKARLKCKVTPEALAQWARQTWTGLQRGQACESAQKELIENVLLTLMAGAKVSDDVLVAQMAKLGR